MMPLALTNAGDTVLVARIGGREDVKKHLEDMGFVVGSEVTVVSSHGGDLIVSVKDAKLALTRELAAKIMVEG